MQRRKIVVVEDEDNLLEALRYNLAKEGYDVVTAASGREGLDLATDAQPDLVILDIMLPEMDGLDVCRHIRGNSDVPILILTAKGEEVDKVVGLELGADDYMVKPFGMRELLARVRALLRRPRFGNATSGANVLTSGNLELDPSSHTVKLNNKDLDLKPREFDLLALLMARKGKVYTRHEILDRLWGQDYVGDTRTVDVHVRWLREKVEPDPGNPERIVTIRGVGYRFQG
jgi:DNA-binding response OmpR family regulator